MIARAVTAAAALLLSRGPVGLQPQPAELDFKTAAALSSTAFKLFYQQLSRDGMRLITAYADVKPAADPRWTLVAAARTGMAGETAAVALSTAPMPSDTGADERAEYCKVLGELAAEPGNMARQAYAYCVEQADAYGLASEPIVALCRTRLALYPEPRAR